MSAKQSQDKLDKRAAALRENLRKRKELASEQKAGKKAAAKEMSKKDTDNGNA